MDCYFCQKKIEEIDYKDANLLKKFISASGKIRPKKKTGLCSKHQRKISGSIKRARNLGLMSPTEKW